MTITLFSAFLAGLLGSIHCIGMCGGIVGALSLGIENTQRRQRLWPFLLGYNSGRLFSYSVAGILVGWLGGQFWQFIPTEQAGKAALWVSAAFMILLGLYIGGWWSLLGWLEKVGGFLWRNIEPFGRRFLPVRSVPQSFLLGLIWGWLPCGLVYSLLVYALTTADPLHGGLLMLCFGLGTLPMLLFMGSAASWLEAMTKQPAVRRSAGAMIIALALFSLYGPVGTL
jgi:sulfite exporter TauE/SafE